MARESKAAKPQLDLFSEASPSRAGASPPTAARKALAGAPGTRGKSAKPPAPAPAAPVPIAPAVPAARPAAPKPAPRATAESMAQKQREI